MTDGLTMVAGATWILLAFAAVAWMAGLGCGCGANRIEKSYRTVIAFVHNRLMPNTNTKRPGSTKSTRSTAATKGRKNTRPASSRRG